MIQTHDLSVGYRTSGRERVLLAHTDVALLPGLTALIGANGRGKSTLLRTLCGMQSPLGGYVTIEGVPIRDMTLRELSRKVAVVTGSAAGASSFTVRELVTLGRQPYTGYFGITRPSDREAVDKALEITGIASLASRHVGALSDGERQKALVAKALAQDTPMVLLDEPTAYLDPAARLSLVGLLAEITASTGKSVLMSTHDIAPVIPHASYLWLMEPFKPVESSETTLTPAPTDAEARLVAGRTSELIADGCMDSVFPGRGIRFDASKGDYVLE